MLLEGRVLPRLLFTGIDAVKGGFWGFGEVGFVAGGETSEVVEVPAQGDIADALGAVEEFGAGGV